MSERSAYTDFFEDLMAEIPHGLASELKDLPQSDWEDTTKYWFTNNLYIGSYEPLDDDAPLENILEALIAGIVPEKPQKSE